MRKCVIISGGDYSPVTIEEGDYVIACDRGYEYALKSGIRPHLIIGDFDSFEGSLPEDIPVRRYKPQKDDTDTMISLKTALEMGFDAIELRCALGGRLDHTIANLQACMYAADKGAAVSIKDESSRLYFLKGPASLKVPKDPAYSLSCFSMSDRCLGLTIKGAAYELENGTFTNSFPLGESNGWGEGDASFTLKEGILAVVLSKLPE